MMQYYYQKGCLYRLRALGERHNMDITVGMYHCMAFSSFNRKNRKVLDLDIYHLVIWNFSHLHVPFRLQTTD